MYQRAREQALDNGCRYHLAALLWRGKRLVHIGINTRKTHPQCIRHYDTGPEAACMHAETNALRFAQPGDRLEVMRFNPNGELRLAKPCEHCQSRIYNAGLQSVHYTDQQGNWQQLC